jgi:hypothetical protein
VRRIEAQMIGAVGAEEVDRLVGALAAIAQDLPSPDRG